jgi:hypothetical protein
MIYISHRGNLSGSNPETENTIEQIDLCISRGYMVEIDVWKIGNDLFLGHDSPKNKVDFSFISKNINPLLCHAKNPEALFYLMDIKSHCFWHDKDDYAITSEGFIIPLPMKHTNDTICTMPEFNSLDIKDIYYCQGIMSDHIEEYFNK